MLHERKILKYSLYGKYASSNENNKKKDNLFKYKKRTLMRPQDLGGGKEIIFRFVNLHVAKRHAAHGKSMCIARGVRGHASPRKFFKMVQFGAF